jgi:two-component system NtrC family response regulator
MHQVFRLIRKVAPNNVPVLIMGAGGTGKDMVAQAIHQRSLRAQEPLVAICCGALPPEMLKSELFGQGRGAFTEAHRTVAGKVELARNGSLLLEEVGELPLELQSRLWHFLQDYSFKRVGGQQRIQADLRLISTSSCDLRELIAQGRFRDDLYHKLSGVKIELPPLKDRGKDVVVMAHAFLKSCSVKLGKDLRGFTPEAIEALQSYPWPGNIRELITTIRRAATVTVGPWVTPENLGLENHFQGNDFQGLGLKEARARFDAKLVADTLARTQGNVRLAAQALKTSPSVIYNLI